MTNCLFYYCELAFFILCLVMCFVLNSLLSDINRASPTSLNLVCPLYPFPISKNVFASFLWITYSWSSAFAWGCVVSRIATRTDVCALTPRPVMNGALRCDWLKSMWRGEDPVSPRGAQCPHQERGNRRGRGGGVMISQRSGHREARSQEAEATAGRRGRWGAESPTPWSFRTSAALSPILVYCKHSTFY